MSSISAISSVTFDQMSQEEDEKRVSESQNAQDMLGLQIGSLLENALSSLMDSAVEAMDSVSGTDTSTTTGSDDDSSTSSTDSTSGDIYYIEEGSDDDSSDQMSTNEQLMLQTGEGLVQMLTGVSSDACENQSSQDGNQQ